MYISRTKFLMSIISVATVASLTTSCGGGDESNEETTLEAVDSNKTQLLNINGEIFSIPSPIQTAMLLKKASTNYNTGILNSPDNASKYSTRYQKSLNLGIYGADLGYITLYDKTQDAITYMQSVKKLADDIGITGAFDKETLEAFQRNIGNQDSMLTLVATAYRASDGYLKNNERNDVSALILAGGWIETLHFACDVFANTKNEDVKRRIAEQKNSLTSLIKMLGQYGTDTDITNLANGLTDLALIYENIESKYVFEKPVTDETKQLTTINSRTDIMITMEQVDAISKKIAEIRKQIIG